MQDLLLLSLAISFIVSIGWVIFIYRLDTHKKEPLGLLAKLFFFGVLVSFPAGTLNGINLALFGMLGTLIFVGFVEEGGKYLGVRYGAFKHKAFDEPIDGVIYASMVALGFAFSENIDYNFMMLSLDNAEETTLGLVARGFTPFLHVLLSGIWGMQMAYYKKNIITFKKLTIWLLISAVLHSSYDILVGYIPIIMIIFLIGGGIYFMRKITHLNRISPFNNAEDINCPQCGVLTTGNSLFCASCGIVIESAILVSKENHCNSCNSTVMDDWKYCKFCGNNL